VVLSNVWAQEHPAGAVWSALAAEVDPAPAGVAG
jgi:hypothetical protein